MGVSVVQRPTRTRNASDRYDKDTIGEVAGALKTVKNGQCVTWDDDCDTEPVARSHARIMGSYLVREGALPEGGFRTHVIPGEGDGHYFPGLSLKPVKAAKS